MEVSSQGFLLSYSDILGILWGFTSWELRACLELDEEIQSSSGGGETGGSLELKQEQL